VPRDVDVSGYLRNVIGKKPGKVKSERVAYEDDVGTSTRLANIHCCC
jgi:hypothetical protein